MHGGVTEVLGLGESAELPRWAWLGLVRGSGERIQRGFGSRTDEIRLVK